METRCGDTVGHALKVVLSQHNFSKFIQNQVQKTMVAWCKTGHFAIFY